MPPGLVRRVDAYARIIVEHGAAMAARGKLATCSCDLCAQARRNLEAIRLSHVHG